MEMKCRVHRSCRKRSGSGLASYGPSLTQMWRKAAVYVDKILKGRTRQSCQSWNLAKSQNSRAALGLTFPDTVLAHADKVIEWERVGTGLRHHHESVR